jgi:phosphatidate cytidylyltransferase
MIDVAYDWGTPALLALVLASKAGDSGAYLVGKSIGRHKLIEHVSPKKTIEGAVGGFVGLAARGLVAAGRLRRRPLDDRRDLLVAAVVNLAGQIGGFGNSLCKRAAGVQGLGAHPPGVRRRARHRRLPLPRDAARVRALLSALAG